MTARRPLLTAVATGSLLCAVWFVPTANATPEHPGAARAATSAGKAPADTGSATAARELSLADSGSADTTPYVFGGIAFLAAGGALVTAAARRSRTQAR
ncbi:hypothetical protein ACFQ2B_10965 [Streptomyces stramineus]|uniref:LPXTG-domain-containing protein cell wall anchor domain protein n=1 Tax=Streptomyces stramineus TaxID=173861 RepID=A0ABN0ZSV7_9ACTN